MKRDARFASAGTPLDTERLRRPSAGCGKTPVVIFFNGTFCPPHPGHLDAMERAREALEGSGEYEVLAGYLSPCSTHYCAGKLGARRMETRHRLALCGMLVARTEWAMVDLNECYHPTRHCDPLGMLFDLEGRCRRALGDDSVQAVWLHGADDTGMLPQRTTVIVVNRGSDGRRARLARIGNVRENDGTRVLVVESKDLGMSSTEIRTSPQALDRCYAEFPAMREYLLAHRLVPCEESSLRTACDRQTLEAFVMESPAWSPQQMSWLLKRAQGMGEIGDSVEFRATRVGAGNGFRSRVYRVEVLDGSVGKVASFAIKVGMRYEEVRDHNEREALFYQRIAPSLASIRVPKCHLVESVQGIFVAVLEDLSTSAVSYSLVVPLEAVLAAANALGEFHGEFHRSGSLFEDPDSCLGWLESMSSAAWQEKLVEHFSRSWRRFSDPFKELASPEFYEFCRDFKRTIPEMVSSLCAASPEVIVHGDLWIHNFCFTPARDRFNQRSSSSPVRELCVFDWQTVCHGSGLFDLASLIDTSRQCEHESVILSCYYDSLVRCGVSEPSFTWTELSTAYRLAKRCSFVYHSPVLGPEAAGWAPPGLSEPVLADLRRR